MNAISHIHPMVMFYYYVTVGWMAMFFNHPLFLSVAVVLLIIVHFTHDGGKTLRTWFPWLLFFALLFTLLNPFFSSRGSHILFYFRGKQVTLEAFVYGGVTSLSIMLIMLLFMSFNIVLNGNKFLFIFSRFLPRTAMLTMMAIRFVPLLKQRLAETMTIQRMKGVQLTTGRLKERATNGMVLMQVLLTWSLEEAVETADSMKARGYGLGKRTAYIPYRMDRQDWQSLFFLLFTSIVCLVGGLLGYGKILIYPALGTLQLYVLDWIVFVSLSLCIAYPLFVEGRERLRWVSFN